MSGCAPRASMRASRVTKVKPMVKHVLAFCLVTAVGSVAADSSPPLPPVPADSSPPPVPEPLAGYPAQADVGLLVWAQTREQRIADGAGVGVSYIRAMDPAGEDPRKKVWIKDIDYTSGTSAVRTEGVYEIRATCQTGRGFEFRYAHLTVTAGKRYLLRCLGGTRRSVRLQIDVY